MEEKSEIYAKSLRREISHNQAANIEYILMFM